MKFLLLALLLAGAAALGGAGAQNKPSFNEDASITARVVQAIQADSVLRRMRISVFTQGKVVRLSGFVDTLADIGRAGVLAEGVTGELGVRNGLRIANRPSLA
jgi:osmotically-inducible protein OsmY